MRTQTNVVFFTSLIFSIDTFSLSNLRTALKYPRPHWISGTYKMTSDRKNRKRIALVTGANRGLGFETGRQLAQLGLTVILSARGVTKGEAAAKQLIERGLDVIFYELDVSNQSHISRIAHQIEQRFGRLDVLVNNAQSCMIPGKMLSMLT